MSRLQLALNVSDLDAAVDFYRRLFKTEPAKRRPGYVNFAVQDPPLKLVLFENAREAGLINHLGVEVFSASEVSDASRYFAEQGMGVDVEESTTCCYAVQDKVWVTAPDDLRWEVYTVLADAPESAALEGDPCCAASPSSDVGSVELAG